MRKKKSTPPFPPGLRAGLFKYSKLLIMTRNYASFGPVRANILDLSVYDRKVKGEGGGLVKMTDRWTDRQTDRCIADICAILHIL